MEAIQMIKYKRLTKKASKAETMRGMNWKYPMDIYIYTDQMGYISG